MKKLTLEDRFWSKVKKTPTCWGWTGSKTCGYGQLKVGAPSRKNIRANRLSWVIHFGEIPDGFWVLHKCDNPECTKPAHLFIGTRKDNEKDKVSKKRHNFGVKHPLNRLSEKDILDIREAVKRGVSQRYLAKKYGVCFQHISNIKLRKKWCHI